jgi:hypothetical protein
MSAYNTRANMPPVHESKWQFVEPKKRSDVGTRYAESFTVRGKKFNEANLNNYITQEC